MQLAFRSLTLVAVCVSVTVDCRPRHQHRMGRFKTAAHAEMSADMRPFLSERNGSMRRGIHTALLVILPILKSANNFVSISDLRRNGFLCVGVKGELHKSRQKGRRDCRFQHIWLELENHQVFFSTSGNQLTKQGRGDLWLAHRGSPQATSVPLKRLLQHPFVRRQRRSEVVNPADPLRSEPHPVKDTGQSQPEQEQTGAVSKETITSCDDPLRVLRSNGPGSPVKTNIADQAEQ